MNLAIAETFFPTAVSDFPTVAQLEERYVRLVLEKTGGRKDRAARILGMNRRTLYRKEREYGMVPSIVPEAGDLAATASLAAERH